MYRISNITPPCTYQGGKQRLSKKIVSSIIDMVDVDDETKIYDLCCGSGAISMEFINQGIDPSNITMVDIGDYGKFWESISKGEFNIDRFREYLSGVPLRQEDIKEYLELEAKNYTECDSIYQYLLLQSGSFGGKAIKSEGGSWVISGFRDYWLPTEDSVRQSPCNVLQPSPEEMVQRVEEIQLMTYGIKAYQEEVIKFLDTTEIGENSIVYIDPPYIDTTGYNGNDIDIKGVIDRVKVPLFISEFKELSEDIIHIQKGKSKGNITGVVKKDREDDILNIFNIRR